MGLKRGEPPRRKTPLSAKRPFRTRSTLRQRSRKTEAVYRDERVPLVKRLLDENPYCELARIIRRVAPAYRDCQLHAIGLHELRKRSQGGSILDVDNLMRCCAPCNSWVEDNPFLAWRAGLTWRAGDTLADIRRRQTEPEEEAA